MGRHADVEALRPARRPKLARWHQAAVGLGMLLGVLAPGPARSAGNAPADPPAVLWGRLAIEEESPAGPWTPLGGVEVRLYHAVPALLAELDRIRDGVRNSGADFDKAVARVQAALAASQPEVPPRVERAERDPRAPVDSDTGRVLRAVTDPEGLFVFRDLPAGAWLLVAMRVTPYAQREAVRPRKPSGTSGLFGGQPFLPSTRPPAKEAELWVKPVHVGAGERVALTLTDRARWLVGPVR